VCVHTLPPSYTHTHTHQYNFFRILLKKSNTKTPRIELEEIGPRADLVCRRNKFASEDLFKRACKKPKALKVLFYK